MRHLALLRGINVGGRNPIRMEALRDTFTRLGYDEVKTYIQSGNVVFTASGTLGALTEAIEAALRREYAYPASVVVRTARQVAAVVAAAPAGFGASPGKHLDDVAFLKPPLTATRLVAVLPTREGVDRVWPGPGVVYYSRLKAEAARSRLTRVVSMPEYQQMTIRNWNTTTRLAHMLTE